MMYIWQHGEWPKMTWQEASFCTLLSEVNLLRGQLLGIVSMFGFKEKNEVLLHALTQEIVHSAKIEGQELSRDSVRSSVARQLGLEYIGLPASDHYTEGVVQVMFDATSRYDDIFDEERLFVWHRALFPTGQSGIHKIDVGIWRQGEGAMQVVSGALGHEKVHYEAPDNSMVPAMMKQFIEWLNNDEVQIDPVVKAAVAHLWFVTIHPFDDGNGRLCRTITELLLSKADKTSQRYYSLSSELLNHRKDYYQHLEEAQKGNLDITEWIIWFLEQMKLALEASLKRTEAVMNKMQFWSKHKETVLNERQRKVINMVLDGFNGKLTSSKWYKICHCSQDTATRDLNDLIAKGIIVKNAEGGRNTSYELII